MHVVSKFFHIVCHTYILKEISHLRIKKTLENQKHTQQILLGVYYKPQLMKQTH